MDAVIVRSESARTTRASGRLTLYARAIAAAFAVAFVASLLLGSGASGAAGRLGGDFPAFYGAGTIAADGAWDELYDLDVQLAAQSALFPDGDGDVLYFAYPPHVAALYAPLSALGYRTAYALHSVAMVLATLAGLWILRPCVGLIRRHFELVAIATLLFHPLFRAVSGGQNTGLTLLLVAMVWRGLHDDNDLLVGLAVALVSYKPQIALPLLGLVVLARRWNAVAVTLAGIGGLWAIGAAVMGPGWLSGWWHDVSAFAELDADINGHNAVSWLGVSEAVFGAGTTMARIVAAPLIALTTAALVIVWARRPPVALDVRMAAGVIGIIMISPHAMFYDAGLLALCGVIVLDRLGSRAAAPLAVAWCAAWLQLGATAVGVAPVFLVIVATAAWTALACRERNTSILGASTAAPV